MSMTSRGKARGRRFAAPRVATARWLQQAIESLEGRTFLSTSTGGADLSFGNGGQALFSINGSGDDIATAITLAPDGNVFVGGYSNSNHAFGTDFGPATTTFARFSPAGNVTFGALGNGQTNLDAFRLNGSVAVGVFPVQGNRYLVLLQHGYYRFVTRIDAQGAVDTSYGTAGLGSLSIVDERAGAFAALPDGGFLQGYFQPNRVERYSADGTPMGKFGPEWQGGPVLAALPDGRIYAGDSLDGIKRLLPDGSVDASFHAPASAASLPGVDPAQTEIERLLPTPDGHLIVVLNTFDDQGFPTSALLRRLNADGSIDKTYGGGLTDTGLGSFWVPDQHSSEPNEIRPKLFVRSDGSLIMLAGQGSVKTATPVLVRIGANGQRDATFGTRIMPAGLAVADLSPGPNGTIVVAASRLRPIFQGAGTTLSDEVLIRFKSDGTIDEGFGDNGQVTADYRQPGAAATAAAAAAAGDQTVIVGQVGGFLGLQETFIARTNGDGSVDSAFGRGGVVRQSPDLFGGVAPAAVLVQPDGKIVVGGSSALRGRTDSDFTLARYNVDGSVDTSFGINGVVHTDLGTHTRDVLSTLLLTGHGKIVAGGQAGQNLFALVRYNAKGKVDRSFGHAGEVLTQFSNDAGMTLAKLVATPEGKIVAVGTGDIETPGDDYPYHQSALTMARYLPSGRRDKTFGNAGKIRLDWQQFAREPLHILGAVLHDDGNLIVGTSSSSGYRNGLTLTGFDVKGRRTGFGGDLNPPWLSTAIPYSMTAGPDGAIFVGGIFTADANASPEGFVVSRFSASDGSYDDTFAGGSVKTLFGPPDEKATASFATLIPSSSGQLMAIGGVATGDGQQGIALTRYNTGGPTPPVLPPGIGAASRIPLPAGAQVDDLVYSPERVAAVGGTAIFSVTGGGANVDGLWSSDGTAGGTRRLAAVRPTRLITIGDVVYLFVANHPDVSDTDYDLWRTDGTIAGTYRLHNASFYPTDSNPYIIGGSAVFFSAADSADGPAGLYRTDGTHAGTKLVKAGLISGLYGADSKLYFEVYDGMFTYVPWTSDGTAAGTHQRSEDTLTFFGTLRGVTVYTKRNADGFPELWRTDGTAAGTQRLGNLPADVNGLDLRLLGRVGGRMVFLDSITFGRSRFTLWATDGTTITRIHDFDYSEPGAAVTAETRLYFTVPDATTDGVSLWTTDGTKTGTKPLHDFQPSPADNGYSGNNQIPADLTAFGDRVLFVAGSTGHGRELWISDGTSAGTKMLRDILPGTTRFSPPLDGPVHIAAVSVDLAFFAADDGIHGNEVWWTDGTPAGTRLLGDLNPGVDGSDAAGFVRAGSRIFFTAKDDAHGQSLRSVRLADLP